MPDASYNTVADQFTKAVGHLEDAAAILVATLPEIQNREVADAIAGSATFATKLATALRKSAANLRAKARYA